MKVHTLLIAALFLFGIVIGYWTGTPDNQDLMDKHYNMIHENNALLEKVHNRLNQLETETTRQVVAGNCQTYAGLLSSIRETISESIRDLSVRSVEATLPASQHADPTERQLELYDAMKARIYAYATSGQPLMEAMSSDPEFQQLTNEQKKQLAMDVVSRLNRGEITMDQIQGR
ncbi:hypothetical protein [Microbulbifer rhizosphaerae]|uniref:Uncharacterized protein n=1 Tax=Microbulbifer rhizosphaerae TaxID=1562603 RepID=A0A7W4W9V2_9GAMM|nr:hypothetical protein [Microbulbifer rhizosphaerae]MBB3060129.1 hypothetical protein [Microbulbifer rhizosphaerae]